MKKRLGICLILIIVICIVIFFLSHRSKKTTCILNSKQSDYQISTEYNIYSKKDLVLKVVSKSVVESSNDEILNEMKKNYNKQYETLNSEYSGYDYKVTVKDNKLYSTVKINYKKYNMKKFIYDNGAMKDYVNDKKQYTLKGAKKYYESIGATCE